MLRRFDRCAAGFDAADFVHRKVRDSLLARLAPVRVEAATVIDAGTGTGAALAALGMRFPGATVVGLDLSLAMLRQRRSAGWFRKPGVVCADANRLPFADASVDVIFASLLLPWIDDTGQFFGEAARVLRAGGLLAFSTLGPDSLGALRRAWHGADGAGHVLEFDDMHDTGDAALRCGLRDPVLDVDMLTVSYRSLPDLFRDLTACGARNSLSGRRKTLTGKRRFSAMTEALCASSSGEAFDIELELVYGHCWGAGHAAEPRTVRIDPARIGRRR